MRIGITGQEGFIGMHLHRYINNLGAGFETVLFEKKYFYDQKLLDIWVDKCDVIVHLAALSRNEDTKVVYDTNVKLVEKLIMSLDKMKIKPHIIFTSSTQEDLNSDYAKSKKFGRILLSEWAKKNNAIYTGILLPNVFGAFARYKYASFIATFSYQLTHNEKPTIIYDSWVRLIYIDDLIKIIMDCINKKENNPEYKINYTDEKKVSEILSQLEYYNECHFVNNCKPTMNSLFDFNLYKTFISYIE